MLLAGGRLTSACSRVASSLTARRSATQGRPARLRHAAAMSAAAGSGAAGAILTDTAAIRKVRAAAQPSTAQEPRRPRALPRWRPVRRRGASHRPVVYAPPRALSAAAGH